VKKRQNRGNKSDLCTCGFLVRGSGFLSGARVQEFKSSGVQGQEFWSRIGVLLRSRSSGVGWFCDGVGGRRDVVNGVLGKAG
jgi:hypothetical protein